MRLIVFWSLLALGMAGHAAFELPSRQSAITLHEQAVFTRVADSLDATALQYLVMGDGTLVGLRKGLPGFYFFDENHRLTHSLPLTGRGRGEMLQPDQVAVAQTDWIAVRDVGNMRINVYNRKGELLMMAMVPEREEFAYGQLFWVGEDLVYTVYEKTEFDQPRFVTPVTSYLFEVIPGKVHKLDRPVKKPDQTPGFALETLYGEQRKLSVKRIQFPNSEGQPGHATFYESSSQIIGKDLKGRFWVQVIDPKTLNFVLAVHDNDGKLLGTIDLKSTEIRAVRLYGQHILVNSGYVDTEQKVILYAIDG